MTEQVGEVLSEDEWLAVKAAAMKSIGCNGYGRHGWIGNHLRQEINGILAARRKVGPTSSITTPTTGAQA